MREGPCIYCGKWCGLQGGCAKSSKMIEMLCTLGVLRLEELSMEYTLISSEAIMNGIAPKR